MPAPGVVPASMARRLLTVVADGVAALVLGGGLVVAGLVASLQAADLDVGRGQVQTGLLLLAAGGLLQWWLLSTRGGTMGMLVVGVRAVTASTGEPLSAGRSLIRLALPVLAWVVPVVGPLLVHLSPAFDPSGRRQGWHDKAARDVVVDASSLAGGRQSDAVGAADDGSVDRVVARAAEGRAAGEAPVEVGRRLETLLAPSGEVRRADLRNAPPRTTPSHGLELAPRLPALVPAGAAAAHASPSGQHAAPDPDTDPSHGAPVRKERPTGAGSGASRHAVHGPVAGSSGPGDAARAGGSGERRAPLTGDRILPTEPVEHREGSTVHPDAPRADLDDDVERTRLRSARARVAYAPSLASAEPPRATLLLWDNRVVVLHGTALVGRNPTPRSGEQLPIQVIAVVDRGRSVSKTHLALGVDAEGVWLRDRNSTNGTVVTLGDGQQILCAPEQLVRVPRGASVAFGDYWLTVTD